MRRSQLTYTYLGTRTTRMSFFADKDYRPTDDAVDVLQRRRCADARDKEIQSVVDV